MINLSVSSVPADGLALLSPLVYVVGGGGESSLSWSIHTQDWQLKD